MRAEWVISLRVWPADLAVDQDVGAGLVVVPHVAGQVLVIPVHLAAVGIPRDQAVGVEVVAGTVIRVEHRHRIAGAPQHLIGGDIVGAGDPHGAAAGLPRIVLVLPGLAAGFAGRRHDVFAPGDLSGRGIDRHDEVAGAAVAAGGAQHDLVLDRERRRGELQVDLAVGEIALPRDLAGLLVGGDHAGRVVGDGDDEIAPQRGAAVRQRHLLLARVHAPDDAAHVAGTPVDLVEHAPLVDDVEEAVLGERRRLQVLVRRSAADRHGIGELEVLDVGLVDLVERREALRIIGAVVHQPVARLLVGIDEPVRRHVGGEGAGAQGEDGAAGEQQVAQGCMSRLHGRLPIYFRIVCCRLRAG